MNKELKHFGVLGMKWGVRRSLKQRVISLKGKPAIVTGNNRFNRTINRNPTKEEILSVAHPISSRIRAKVQTAIKKTKSRVNNDHISKEDMAKMNSILNNPKSKRSDIEWALKKSGVDPKTVKTMNTPEKFAKADLEESRDFVKKYVKYTLGSIVVGVGVAKVATMLIENHFAGVRLAKFERILNN